MIYKDVELFGFNDIENDHDYEGVVRPCRLPLSLHPHINPSAYKVCRWPANGEIRFFTDGEKLFPVSMRDNQ
ncbi:MAG: hypothetical protein ACYTFY_08840 [Planctomycetota bacterium]|jgi:hypothetical protein